MVYQIKKHWKVVICMAIFLCMSSILVSQNMQTYPSITNAILDLVSMVENMNIQAGISNSLDAKLDSALNALDDVNNNNDVAALNSMSAFINAVIAQRGKQITIADANSLLAAADNVITQLEIRATGVCPI